MDAPICTEKEPPWLWLNAGTYIDPYYRKTKREAVRRVTRNFPFYTESDVRLICATCISLEISIHLGIHRGMSWQSFKDHLKVFFERHPNSFWFKPEQIQDIGITSNPLDMAPAIDDTKYDLFTVIPDNAMIFLSQIKVNDKWYFIK